MPLGPKLVFAFLLVGLASSVFWLFVRVAMGSANMLGIVIQIALLIGLYTRQTVAWATARWLTALGASITSIMFLLVVMSGATKFWVLALVAFEIVLSWVFFALLGRADSRVFFNAPRKA